MRLLCLLLWYTLAVVGPMKLEQKGKEGSCDRNNLNKFKCYVTVGEYSSIDKKRLTSASKRDQSS